MTDIRTVEYAPSRRDDVARLLADVWADPRAGSDLAWWFEAPPSEPGSLALAEVDGRLAGVVGMSYVCMRAGGEPVKAGVIVGIATHPDFRMRGVFSTLLHDIEEEGRRRGAQVTFSMPNRSSLPGLLRSGWRVLRTQRVWARPLGLPARIDATVTRVERFDASAETAWARATGSSDRVVVDAEHLNWRYVDAPHDYRRFAVGDRGYAVVRRMVERGIDTGMICTLVAAERPVFRALVAACAAEMRGARLLAALRPPERTGRWLAAGFLPTPRALPIVGKPLDGAPLSARPVFEFGDHDVV